MPKSAPALPESQVTPEPGLEKRTRRQFAPDYKLRIIVEADACKHGELGPDFDSYWAHPGPGREWIVRRSGS